MSFDAQERAIDTAQPIELYEFTYGVNKFLYTTQATNYVVGNTVYEAIPISRQSMKISTDSRRDQLILTAPRDFQIAQFFKISSPGEPINLTIKKKHRNDTEAIVEWLGRVMAAEWGGSGVKLTCESVYSVIQKRGLTRVYSYACPFTLYGKECKVDAGAYKRTATLTAVNATVLTSVDFGTQVDGYWTGGYISWESPDKILFTRFVTGHSGNQISLSQQLQGLAVGDRVDIYPGCNHTLETCRYKFNNLLNYGGFPWIPNKNPFTSSSSIFW